MEATIEKVRFHSPRRESRGQIQRVISRLCKILEDIYPHWDEFPKGEFIWLSNPNIQIVGYKGNGVEKFKVNGRDVGDVVALEKFLLKVDSPDVLKKLVWRWQGC